MKVKIFNEHKKRLSSKMFGLFFEDINYAGDGGLYAELIENRQFAFKKASPGKIEKQYLVEDAFLYGWKNNNGKMEIKKEKPLSNNNPQYMTFTGPGSFENKAYDGIFMKENLTYHILIWVRCLFDTTITLEIANDYHIITRDIQLKASQEWQKATCSISSGVPLEAGTFTIIQKDGAIDYGYISMMPSDAVLGIFRKDLYEKLEDLNPGFLRFPGGCIVEGANLENRYQWKNTIGKPWDRKWNWSRWSVHDVTMGTDNPKYYPYTNQSYGLGFFEYFMLAELLEAKPLPVLNVGLACQFQSDELVKIDDKEFDCYIQDALDLIEFANGDVSTLWGAFRYRLGHPLPFNLEYIGIGNEQWQTDKVDFFERYEAFEKAIHEVYPNIKLIGSAGPFVNTDEYAKAWNFYNDKTDQDSNFVDCVDEHYYMPPNWFYENENMYDNWNRDYKVFAGEYAAHTTKKQNNFESAMAEGSFMCGLERNGDVVQFASVAPLFCRLGYEHWKPDFIWFDSKEVMLTPNYFVQQLFANYTGIHIHEYEYETEIEGIYLACSSDENNYYIKVINPTSSLLTLSQIQLEDTILPLNNCKVAQIHGESLEVENTFDCTNIELKEFHLNKEELPIPAYSLQAIIIHK